MKCKFHITGKENIEELGKSLYMTIKNLEEIMKEDKKKINKKELIYVSVDIPEKK